jgi:hypothetical protein
MRSELAKINGQRMRFRAKVEYFSSKRGWRGRPEPTVCLTNVQFVATGELATDHLWFTTGAWTDGLLPGDVFEFDARVDAYEKGYRGRRAEELGMDSYSIDYHLERPTKVVVVNPVEAPAAA